VPGGDEEYLSPARPLAASRPARPQAPDPRLPRPDSQVSNRLHDDVQAALEHLYDYVFLQGHPLATVVGTALEGWHRGATLHRLLVETIERLKPPDGTPAHSHLWRRHRHAFMRYIESATVAQIAEELGVSERQARRDNNDAVEAIAELLRQRLGPALAAYQAKVGNQPAGQRASTGPAVGLDKEVARIGSIEPRGPTRLDEVVDGVLATSANLAEARGLAFDLQLSPVPVLVRTERTAVRQIILSMVVGIIEATVPGHCVLVSVDAGADSAAVSVSGALAMTPDAALLEGLENRLAIAKRLAAPQGGTVTRQIEAGELRLSLRLPATRVTTVLLVDDNPGMLRLLKRYLGGSEYAVLEAGSPDEALKLAQEAQPNVITLDVMMPAKDGWEVLQTLRAQPRTRHIPVVVCSVLKERDLALSLGAAAFLVKPLTQGALLQALSRVRHPPEH